MTLKELQKAPFPWFGGKRKAAPLIWSALGDVHHYVEPFFGSGAVLLERPNEANRTYYSETVNDADGLLVNAWRSIQLSPDATADAASNPVAEADLHARHVAILRWKSDQPLERLMGDPTFHDPIIAGWWIWGQCCWIGSGWCSGQGPWTSIDGLFQRAPKGGVSRQLPHLGNDGKGVNRPGAREPGVSRQLPHLADDGQGVNHAGAREPGVSRKLPHLGNDGKGVNRPGTREPGVESEEMFHPVTMPEVRRWFAYLSARLRHVRVLNGDWARSVTGSASKTLSVRMGSGMCGVFLDPPYGDVRQDGLYSHDSLDVAASVREWCAANGDDPKYRIVLAGYDTEHTDLDARGWRVVEWFSAGFLRGGMGNTSKSKSKAGELNQQKRERLWLSPHCLAHEEKAPQATEALQRSLW